MLKGVQQHVLAYMRIRLSGAEGRLVLNDMKCGGVCGAAGHGHDHEAHRVSCLMAQPQVQDKMEVYTGCHVSHGRDLSACCTQAPFKVRRTDVVGASTKGQQRTL